MRLRHFFFFPILERTGKKPIGESCAAFVPILILMIKGSLVFAALVVPTGIEPVTLRVGDSVGNHIGFLPILIGLTMFLFWQPGRLCAVLVPIENR